jgi:hypothetical protein
VSTQFIQCGEYRSAVKVSTCNTAPIIVLRHVANTSGLLYAGQDGRIGSTRCVAPSGCCTLLCLQGIRDLEAHRQELQLPVYVAHGTKDAVTDINVSTVCCWQAAVAAAVGSYMPSCSLYGQHHVCLMVFEEHLE